jgi:carbon monoxide dehydrogenase subunit G
MHIQFAGDFSVSKMREEVYSFLTDPQRFCPMLPDYKSMEMQDDSHFIVTVSIGISHIRGNAKVRMELAEAEFPVRAVYMGKGDVPGGSTILTAGFDLEEQPGGTKLLWKGETQIVGRLASLGGGLLEPLAKKNLHKLITGLQAALSSDGQPAHAAEPEPIAEPPQLAGESAGPTD